MGQRYKVYDIKCGKCGSYVLTYHKYGAGKGILRLYFSNIVAPENFASLDQGDFRDIKAVPNLHCPNCDTVLGVAALSKSKKWVFRMRQGFFHRKLKK